MLLRVKTYYQQNIKQSKGIPTQPPMPSRDLLSQRASHLHDRLSSHHYNSNLLRSQAQSSRTSPATEKHKIFHSLPNPQDTTPSWGRSGRRGGKPAPVSNPDRPKSKIRNALILALRGVRRADGGGGREDVDGAAAAIDRGGNWEFWSITRSSRRFLLLWPRR